MSRGKCGGSPTAVISVSKPEGSTMRNYNFPPVLHGHPYAGIQAERVCEWDAKETMLYSEQM
jgi:hypothetical protein